MWKRIRSILKFILFNSIVKRCFNVFIIRIILHSRLKLLKSLRISSPLPPPRRFMRNIRGRRGKQYVYSWNDLFYLDFAFRILNFPQMDRQHPHQTGLWCLSSEDKGASPVFIQYLNLWDMLGSACQRWTLLIDFAHFLLRLNQQLGPVVRTPVSANPGFFFFLSRALYRIIFSILFRVSNHEIVGKDNKTEFDF